MRSLSKWAVLVSLSVNASMVSAVEQLKLGGRIINEGQQPIAGAQVLVNGLAMSLDQQGRFHHQVNPADIYQLTISADGYYSSTQTFSHHELNSGGSYQSAQGSEIPAITLVKKKHGRTLFTFGGDAMMGRRYFTPHPDEPVVIRPSHKIEDTRHIVKEVKPYLSQADFAVVNLETIITDQAPEQKAPKSVVFHSPPETLQALSWAGVDYVDLGNNHLYDYLEKGLSLTFKHLKNSTLAYSGAGHNEADALKGHRQTIGTTPFSFLGYVGWKGSFSPHQAAEGDKGGAALGSIDNIRNSVRRESEAGFATVVQYHGSQEYSDGPTGNTELRLKTAIDAGADLVIAHHPHVAQGFEIYQGKLIAYSMGNFIFDQYFPSTPQSFMLNVWMDGEQFHRAEVIPIYLKGYIPTPATGIQRHALMKRVSRLSAKNGVNIDVSGGHGVISAKPATQSARQFELTLTTKNNNSVHSLYQSPWQFAVSEIKDARPGTQYRLGQNLLHGSDFESFQAFGINERSWYKDNSQSGPSTEQAYTGQYSFKLALEQSGQATMGMTKFRRKFRNANPMTLSAQLYSEQDISLKLYIQERKKGLGHLASLRDAPKQLLATQTVSASQQWQTLTIPFTSPRSKSSRFRILLEASNNNDQDSKPVYLDDVALIQWLSAYTNADNTTKNDARHQASHIEIRQTGKPQKALEVVLTTN